MGFNEEKDYVNSDDDDDDYEAGEDDGDEEDNGNDNDNDENDDNDDDNDVDDDFERNGDENVDDEGETDLSVDEFRNFVCELASSRPDTWSSKKRNDQIQQVNECLGFLSGSKVSSVSLSKSTSSSSYLIALFEELAEWQGSCSSLFAYQRIVKIFLNATLSLSLMSDGTETVIPPLLTKICMNLCRLLQLANDVDLMEICLKQLQASVSVTTTTLSSQVDNDSKATIPMISSSASVLLNIFHQLATQPESQHQQLPPQISLVVPALTLGCKLDDILSSSLEMESSKSSSGIDWCNLLLQYSLSRLTTPSEMILARFILQRDCAAINSLATTSSWNASISSTLLLKLKSHPDQALPTVLGWMENLYIGAAPTVDDEWIALLLKHLTSMKENDNPVNSGKILLAWSKQSKECWETIASALIVKSKPQLAPARVAVYETLQRLTISTPTTTTTTTATNETDSVNNTNASTKCVDLGNVKESILNEVVAGIISLLKKEPKPEHRTIGFQALVSWLALTKRPFLQNKSNASFSTTLGYKQAINEFIRQPIMAKKVAGDASTMLTLLVRNVHPDLLQSFALDLWGQFDSNLDITKNVKQWNAALESLIELAATKKSLQVESLILLYFTLLYTSTTTNSSDPTLSNKNISALPVFVVKIISAGASAVTSSTAAKKDSLPLSFLYSQSMLDAISTNDIVSTLLPRVIALYTQLCSSSSSITSSALPSVFPKGKQTPVTRVIARCCMYPRSYEYTITSTSTIIPDSKQHTIIVGKTTTSNENHHASIVIVDSIQKILTYQPSAAESLTISLLEQVNVSANEFEIMSKGLNDTRESRENDSYAKMAITPSSASSSSSPDSNSAFLTSTSTIGSNKLMKGHGSENSTHSGFDANAVRRAARLYIKPLLSTLSLSEVQTTSNETNTVICTLTRALVLMHTGTSIKSEGHQRAALIVNTLNIFRDVIVSLSGAVTSSTSQTESTLQHVRATIANELVTLVSSHSVPSFHKKTTSTSTSTTITNKDDEKGRSTSMDTVVISDFVHKACISLLVSLGGIASNYQPDYEIDDAEDIKHYSFVSLLCKDNIAPLLSSKLRDKLKLVEELSHLDVEIFLSPFGTVIPDPSTTNSASQQNTTKKVGGKHLTEDEEWELQMKKELEEKKRKELGNGGSSNDDKKLAQKFDEDRVKIGGLLRGDFMRCLDSVRYLCSSDIEIGNACLPIVSESVLRATISNCPAMQGYKPLSEKCFETLTTLGTCVYEISEVHAPTMATALTISCRRKSNEGNTEPHTTITTKEEQSQDEPVRVSPLPSPCAPAACVIYEMDQLHDTLSGASFAFLFPVIQASLMGIRTTVGCEGSLRVLHKHTELLRDDAYDPVVAILRKDMAISVLELLKYDRAMTFHDPTPFETLVECYQTSSTNLAGAPLSTGELAPLLDERGALGSTLCRVAALRVIGSIAQDHQKFMKNNPLVENRVWVNCFDSNETIRNEARKTWSVIHGTPDSFDDDDFSSVPRPSPLYAVSLLPLLSHSNASIAQAAAMAYAQAMRMHANSIGRNIETLCKLYIDAFPTLSTTQGSSSTGKTNIPMAAVVAPPPAKKPLSTGLPKKKVAPAKSALDVVGLGKPKTSVKKKTAQQSLLLKPKQERTLDQDEIANMFKTGPVILKTTMTEEKDSPPRIAVRSGVIRAIAALAQSKVEFDEGTLKLLTSFLMAYGIADSNDDVKGAARNALRDIVASSGGTEAAIAFLLPHLDTVLKTGFADESSLGSLVKDKVPKDVSSSDRRKEGAVVALGSVALHLQGPESDDKVDSTVDMLLTALKTPSEEVQQSVADALTKLMKKGRTGARVESILKSLLHDCLQSDSLAARRGAAYGLSAVVKGSGIATLKKYEIVKQLEESCSSGSSKSKEGSLYAIELLSNRLGLLFEPYVIVLLPSLLKSFSDSSDHVRAAANETTGLIMSKLSAHGVKLVMPAVLMAFNDPAWRTKQASIRMLGAMSHLAPKQLASALPKVVPKLTEAFSDTHPKVKAAAQEALNEISTVIKNPEVSSISAVLLKALTDPADYTIKALETLIQTEFLHAIDAPSLALIVPILHRGLRERGAATKRYGGLIAGNICTMISDPKDFAPYLPTLLPDIQVTLLDPIPDVRSTSAKALGSLTRSLGDHILPELRPWLVMKLRDSTCSSAERSGAAQGLTEVLIASGSETVETTMRDEILPLRSYPDSCTREGVLWMLTFLPPALGQGFTPLIDDSLPALIGGLSDDSEPVRDVAMRAGRVLIRSHGKVHVDKILPSLEKGLGDKDYRIRVASLSLLGDLLSMIGGTQVIRGEGDTQDDIRKAERAQAQIALVLGSDTRRRVLSGLYLARSDSVHMVRSSALQVWKTVVSVTARTLRDILPVLVSRIIDDLASGNEEKTEVAGRCLGDLVSKLGDSVLPQIIPVLRNALHDGNEHTKRGVCVGLVEVINCSTKDQIIKFIEIIIKVVQVALSDDNESVRRIAAVSFQSLYNVVGTRAFDEVVPSLLVALERTDQSETERVRALNGLTGILRIRSRELLPYIIPRLISRPITVNHANALCRIAEVTGSTIHYHFTSIVPALLLEMSEIETYTANRADAIVACTKAICRSVEEIGLNSLVSEIVAKCSSDKAGIRASSCKMFDFIATERAERQDFYDQIPIMSRELIYRLNDDNDTVLKAANGALTSLSKFVPAQELVKHVEFMRNILASMVSEARRRKGGVGDGEFLLPGFNIPKGVEPFIPIFQQGILYGTPNIREVSATGLGEVIGFTSTKYLAGPLIVKMTGPLLRIVGDRNPSNVKISILKTLGLILVKGGQALRAFVPQFQTTFVKALADPARQVRVEAIRALSLLMPLTTRVDLLVKELISGSLGKSAIGEGVAATAVQTATLDALATVLEQGGTKAKLPTTFTSALDCSKDLILSSDPGIRESSAKVMGACCDLLGSQSTEELIRNEVLSCIGSGSTEERHGMLCAIRRILASKVGSDLNDKLTIELKKAIVNALAYDKEIVRVAACVALGAVIGRSPDPRASIRKSESEILKIMNNTQETIDVHRAIARGLCVALLMIDPEKRVDFLGQAMLDCCLHLALGSSSRVQLAFNDVLWLALDVAAGDAGLDRYCSIAMFDNQRSMKSLHSKVLFRIKDLSILEN